MDVVFWKELGDHFSSRRFMILLAIIVLTGVWAIYASGQSIRQEAEGIPTDFVFLLLLTSQSGGLLSLATFIGLLGP
ncbi:MAG: ABC transporter, partial [Deltaproteobacteria bacterium]|nr:ABC transporter [Deltaproteobacteria bacterium]